MKITALAAILLLAVLLASPFINSYNAYSLSQTFQAVSFWGSSSAPLLASPGSSNLPLTIQVINVGPNTVTSLSISFLSYFPLIPASGQARNLSSYCQYRSLVHQYRCLGIIVYSLMLRRESTTKPFR